MEEKRFTLRMNGDLFVEISNLAQEHRRSVAKEIECAIAEYVEKEKRRAIRTQRNTEDGKTAEDILNELAALGDRYDKFRK